MKTLWEYILGGAAVVGLIIAVGTWLSGRIARREISRLIEEERKATRKLIAKMQRRTRISRRR